MFSFNQLPYIPYSFKQVNLLPQSTYCLQIELVDHPYCNPHVMTIGHQGKGFKQFDAYVDNASQSMKFYFNVPTPASFRFFGLLKQKNTIFTTNQCEKCQAHPVYSVGIQTHYLSNMIVSHTTRPELPSIKLV